MVRATALLTASLLALTLIIGCGISLPPTPRAAAPVPTTAIEAKAAPHADGDHAHKPGAHGGTIVEIGRDSYHAEAAFEKNGTVRVFILGKDESRIAEVESQVLTAWARAEGATDSAEFKLDAVPQAGDTSGKTSQFVGTLPEAARGKAVTITVPSIRIGGERFRFSFESPHAEAHAEEPMPTKVSGTEAEELYLKPGGLYTDADIKANGGVPAPEKYKGNFSRHNMKPQPGDKICPVTQTKANATFTWVVGGKPYEFCCPPCIDEFVKTAKEHPEEVKAPGEYVKQ